MNNAVAEKENKWEVIYNYKQSSKTHFSKELIVDNIEFLSDCIFGSKNDGEVFAMGSLSTKGDRYNIALFNSFMTFSTNALGLSYKYSNLADRHTKFWCIKKKDGVVTYSNIFEKLSGQTYIVRPVNADKEITLVDFDKYTTIEDLYKMLCSNNVSIKLYDYQ